MSLRKEIRFVARLIPASSFAAALLFAPACVERPREEVIRKRVRQDMGIIWVDFTLRDVLPTGGGPAVQRP
jgi:hypothetical protein